MVVTLDVTVPLVGSALIALIGGGVFWSGARQYRRQRAVVRRAEQASGRLEEVGVKKIQNGTQSMYVPAVEYEYQTPTQRLRGTTVYPGNSEYVKLFDTESATESAIEEYEPGTPTDVYYDPANPEHSFLDPSPHRGPNVARMLFGLGLIALAAGVAVQSGVI